MENSDPYLTKPYNIVKYNQTFGFVMGKISDSSNLKFHSWMTKKKKKKGQTSIT